MDKNPSGTFKIMHLKTGIILLTTATLLFFISNNIQVGKTFINEDLERYMGSPSSSDESVETIETPTDEDRFACRL